MNQVELERFWRLAGKMRQGYTLDRDEQAAFRRAGREWRSIYRQLGQRDRVLYVERLLKAAVNVGRKEKAKPVRVTLSNILR